MWSVSEKNDPDSDSWELSVVRSDNHHGMTSHGWFGSEKIMVFSSGGPCHLKAHPALVSGYRDMAKDLAVKLNNGSIRNESM